MEQAPPASSEPQAAGKWSARTRSVVAAVAGALTLAFALWAYASYREYQRRAEVIERKSPFAGVVIVATADAEALLRQKGLLKEMDARAARVACTLEEEMCGKGIVSRYSIGPDGVVKIELSGARIVAFQGKKILLTPLLTNGAVAWKCLTDVAPEFVPVPGDPSGIQGGRCEPGKPDWPELPSRVDKPKAG